MYIIALHTFCLATTCHIKHHAAVLCSFFFTFLAKNMFVNCYLDDDDDDQVYIQKIYSAAFSMRKVCNFAFYSIHILLIQSHIFEMLAKWTFFFFSLNVLMLCNFYSVIFDQLVKVIEVIIYLTFQKCTVFMEPNKFFGTDSCNLRRRGIKRHVSSLKMWHSGGDCTLLKFTYIFFLDFPGTCLHMSTKSHAVKWSDQLPNFFQLTCESWLVSSKMKKRDQLTRI